MNVRSKFFVIFLFFSSVALSAQKFATRANVNIINATTMPLKMSVNYTGPKGENRGGEVKLIPGNDMGLFSVDAKSLELKVVVEDEKNPVLGANGHVKLAGELATNCYVVYLALVGKKVDGEMVEIPTLKFKKVKVATEAGGASLSVVSVCAEAKILKFGTRQTRLEPWKSWLLDGWRGGEVSVTFEGKNVGKIESRDEPLTMLAVVYEDAEKKPLLNCFVYAIRK